MSTENPYEQSPTPERDTSSPSPDYPGPIIPAQGGLPSWGAYDRHTGLPGNVNAHGYGREYAGWWHRVGAYFLDSIPTFIVMLLVSLIFGEPFTTTTTASGQVTTDFDATAALFNYGLSLGWFLFNWVYLQGKTGQTVGKKVAGIAVLGAQTGQPIGMGMAFVRYLAHILDAIPCYLGFLWPLWDAEKRTFADMLCNTRVYKV